MPWYHGDRPVRIAALQGTRVRARRGRRTQPGEEARVSKSTRPRALPHTRSYAPRWCARWRRRVRVLHAHALCCQLVKVRRQSNRVHCAQHVVTLLIRHQEQDVGPRVARPKGEATTQVAQQQHCEHVANRRHRGRRAHTRRPTRKDPRCNMRKQHFMRGPAPGSALCPRTQPGPRAPAQAGTPLHRRHACR